MIIFRFLLLRGSENTKKSRRLAKEKIKKELINSINIKDVTEIEELNEEAEKVEKSEEAADIIKQYEKILRTTRKLHYICSLSSRKGVWSVSGKEKVYEIGQQV